MAEGSKRRRSSRRSSSRSGSASHGEQKFGTNVKATRQPILLIATDVCIWGTMIAVAIGFGGRMAMGQVALILGTTATAVCWMLYQLTSSEPRYVWTGSEWLWTAGILVGVAQIAPIPTDLMVKISPQIKQILPFWFDPETSSVLPSAWHQLSLAPWESTAAVAVFVSYAIMFLIVAQRTRTIKDVEQMLCGCALASVAMMVFAQVQFMTTNGRFFWVYEHPYMTTETYPLGCFTNRNHLAQFMALGIGPLVWWLLRRLQQQQLDVEQRKGLPLALHSLCVSLLITCLVAIALTALMTLSRGGFLAIGIASFVALVMMYRVGLMSLRFAAAMFLVCGLTTSLFSFTKFEGLLSERLEQETGREEIWAANVQVAKDFPILGTGLGTHADAYRLHIDKPKDDGVEYTHAESGYLQIASECGVAGLAVLTLFIITSFWWCVGALWNQDTKVTSAAAAVMASLTANVLHAIGDFFWYTPLCMVMLGIQLACAMRAYRLTRQEAGRFVFSFRLPRIVTAGALCSLVPLTIWMLDMRWGAALAEPHYHESLLLSRQDEKDLTEEEQNETSKQRIREVLLAAKLNPRDARLQEMASESYTQLFDLKQLDSDNTMSLMMMRDAVKTSDFESVEAANEWLNRAAGANAKTLRQSAQALRRALVNCPLRAKSYVQMAELSFLDKHSDEKFQERCLMQSLKLRPKDAEIMYLVGKLSLQEGEVEKAMSYWRPAFERSDFAQERISLILAGQVEPEFFQKEFKLDAKALGVVASAFGLAGREYESHQVKRQFVRQAMTEARTMKPDEDLELLLVAARNACVDIEDSRAAVEVMSYAVKRLPQSYTIHYLLSIDLIGADRTADAAEHLKWCTTRRPDDVNLRRAATAAMTEHLKQNSAKLPSAAKPTEIEQMGGRH